MARRASYIKNNWDADANHLILDSGDIFSYKAKSRPREADCILEILSHLNYDAINLGEKELQLGPKRLSTFCRKFETPFLSANVFEREREISLVAPYRIKKFSGIKIGIFGLIDEKLATRLSDSLRIEPAEPVARQIVAELRNRCDLIILLSHLTWERSVELAQQVPGVDVIISGHFAYREKGVRKIGETLVIQTRQYGQSVGHLLLHLKNKKISQFEDLSRPLDESVPEDSSVQALVRLCEQRQGIQTVPARSRRTSVRATGYYVQAERCRRCHLKIYDQWKTTGHARAFSRLSGNQRENRACLPCHTTGFEISNGFRNLNTNPELINVQCETCHGTRFQHVRNFESIYPQNDEQIAENPDLMATVNPAVCLECHTRERDPDFNLENSFKNFTHVE